MGKKKRVAIDMISQPKKKCAKRSFLVNDDRLSQLPDEILVDILSLLSINEAARTSVLSSRWINLWKHTPSLVFDADHSVLDKLRSRSELFKREKHKYVKWVNTVIRSRESLPLKEFRIHFRLNRSSRNSITRWLEFAFSGQLQSLELDFRNYCDMSKYYCFPEELLAPKSDTVCINRPRMLVAGFKSLKALVFKNLHVSDGAIEYFLHNCPLLEQLIVHESGKISKLEVCGPSLRLKHLEILFCMELGLLKVSAPTLTTLSVTRLQGLLLENVPMLVNVSVRCGDDDISIQHLFDGLSCCISQLQTLWLALDMKYLRGEMSALCDLPKMPKLKKLSIVYGARGDESLIRLAALIRASPCLEEFELQFKWYKRKDRQVNDAIIRSPHHHLRVFKFSGCYGCANDVELFRYILENCVVLEKIIIDPLCLGVRDRLEVEQTARKTAKEKLAPQVPQHIDLVIL